MQNEQIVSIDQFLANANDLIEQLHTTRSRLILTKEGSAVAVVQDMREYRKLLDALSMLKLMAQGEKDIQAGRVKKQEEVFSSLMERLESMGAEKV